MTPSSDSGEARDADPRLYLTIGDVKVSIRSDLKGLLNEVASLYPVASEAHVPSQTIQIDVRQTRSRMFSPRYRVYADRQEVGSERRAREVFPFIEWGINLRVIATRAQYVQLHAASMSHGGDGFIFAGGSGSGKSTLAAGLMTRGWNYYCDEFALINRNTLCLHPFPKPLCIKAGSFSVMRRLHLPFARRGDYIKSQKGRVGYINPYKVEGHSVGGSAPVKFVIFPTYVENKSPQLQPISRTRALMDLAGCVFNRHVFDDQALSILSQVVQGAACFRLDTGDIQATCDLLESELCHVPDSCEDKSMPDNGLISASQRRTRKPTGPLLSRRAMLKRGAKLAYITPTVLTLTAQQAFAAGSNPSSACSTALATGELCNTDADCCSSDCDLGICQ